MIGVVLRLLNVCVIYIFTTFAAFILMKLVSLNHL